MKIWDNLSPKEKVKRWSHAVKVIENLGKHEIEKHFDMSIWGDKTECGTVCCAAGHCGMDPKFRKQGFKLIFKKYRPPFESESGWDCDWSIDPASFFGKDAYYEIFTNEDFMDLKGKKAYKIVLEAMKAYLKELKAYA